MQKLSLLERFSDPEEIYHTSPRVLETVEGLTEKMREALNDKNIAQAEKILEESREKDIGIMGFGSRLYPNRLRNIEDPPMVLYYQGTIPDFEAQPVISVVGTRKATAYGLSTARRMGSQISACGALVASGVAGGIDAAAMQGVLDSGEPVVGVLGCGIDVVYPKSSKGIYEQTVRKGCLISEYPPGTKPFAWNFPRRNRILSGISNGVLVVEAPEKSGALITAERAVEQGRDLFVVPGNIDVPACAGSNGLLREYAAAVCSGWDVVKDYASLYPGRIVKRELPETNMAAVAQSVTYPGSENKKPIDNPDAPPYSKPSEQTLLPEEEKILSQIGPEPMLIDDLIALTDMPAGKVLATLTMLALHGFVQNHPGRRVSLNVKRN